MSSYDKFPCIAVPDSQGSVATGWDAIARRLWKNQIHTSRKVVIAVECYPGVNDSQIRERLGARLAPALTIDPAQALLPSDKIDSLVAPALGGNDPVFGFLLSTLELPDFFDASKIQRFRAMIASVKRGVILIIGCGARLVADGDLFVYADLARWEAQLRFRSGEIGNLGAQNAELPASLKYRRAYFVDWRVGDRWKRPLIPKFDFLLDTTDPCTPKLADGSTIRRGLNQAVSQPFRLVPFFDPAPWGGQWMKQVFDLEESVRNYGWCFDCVPEENSLLFDLGGTRIELPSLDLVFNQPRRLLGEAVHARFGDEFPIRFDILDTLGGGNLSLQVHPLTEYIQRHFGMHYTQDESYYVLDAAPGANVYLGLREKTDPFRMLEDLNKAQAGGMAFDADRYVEKWPAKKHDHFLIPAGTVHCSGANSVVLEISATPYIFTFKIWDWERPGLDGQPRPTHLEHAAANIQWERTTAWTRGNLINLAVPIGEGDGWREERTGLHEREFIETRRHRFRKAVLHETCGAVNVLNLVEGDEAVVESPSGAFAPFVVHYAETFILPAAIGTYSMRPYGRSEGGECVTMKAYVRV